MINHKLYQDLAARVRGFIADTTEVLRHAGSHPHSASQTAPLVQEARLELQDNNFNQLALDIFGFQFEANPVLNSLGRQAGRTPDRITHWTEIPAIPTLAFKTLPVTCLPQSSRFQWFESSGTTGTQRGCHYHDETSLSVYKASLHPPFFQHLLSNLREPFQIILLTPQACETPRSSLAYMLDAVVRKWAPHAHRFCGQVSADGTWTINFDACLSAIQSALVTQASVLIAGTAFSFVHLLDELRQRSVRFQLPIGSRLMETGGYKGQSRTVEKAALFAALQQTLGIPQRAMVSEYGMCELGSQAYDSVAGPPSSPTHPSENVRRRRFRFPPWARLRIVSPETKTEVEPGTIGIIQVLDLANVASSIGIETQDLGLRLTDGFELCGRAAEAEPRGCSLQMLT